MVDRVNYIWRLLATGLSFTTFAVGGLLIAVMVFPVVSLFPMSQMRRLKLGRLIIHYAFAMFIWWMNTLRVLSFEVHGADKLGGKTSELIVANHPSLIDVVFLISLLKSVNCVVKSALWRNPFTWGPVSAASYIRNQGAESLIAESIATLDSGQSLVVFPEGSRTVPGQPIRFQRGAANIAARSSRPVRPVVITCRPGTLSKGEKWYKVPETKPHFVIRVKEAFSVSDVVDFKDPPSLAARKLTRYLETYFEEEIVKNDCN